MDVFLVDLLSPTFIQHVRLQVNNLYKKFLTVGNNVKRVGERFLEKERSLNDVFDIRHANAKNVYELNKKIAAMSKPALYYATLSPPSRAVMLTAKAIGLELELRPINLLKGEHLTPEFVKLNPQHTIPTLIDGDVSVIDSHAICAYLVEKYGKGHESLYPKDLAKRAAVDARLHLDSGHLFARLRFLYEPVLYFGSTDCSIDKIAYVQKCYEILEGFLKDQAYLCGDDLTIADLCCVATVTSVNDVAPIDEFKFAKVHAWLKKLAELPYYKDTNEEGAEELKALFKAKLAENRSK